MGDSISFLTPQQRNLARLDLNGLTIKLAVRRIGDNHISEKKFNFRYIPHNMTDCIFCFHNLDTDEEISIKKNKKRGKRALNMSNYTGKDKLYKDQSPPKYTMVEVAQTQNDFNMKNEDGSEGSSSSSHGYFSSPENIPSPPLPKRIVHETPEYLIPSTVFESTTPSTTGYSFSSFMSSPVNIDFSPNDIMEFGKYAANLPDLINKDGARPSLAPNNCKAKFHADPDVNEEKEQIKDSDKPAAPFDPFPYVSRFVILFFVFLFLQVLACIFVFQEEEEIPFFEFSTSSFAFSATTIFMES